MARQFWTCSVCGANLDHNEECDCQSIAIDASTIPNTELDRLARPLLECVAKYFEDPKVDAEFKRWQRKREKKKTAV